jgi:NADPH:quinone reductase-like Zn-dependent oxidoreductase
LKLSKCLINKKSISIFIQNYIIMQAAFLIKKGKASKSFEWREVAKPTIKENEVLIKVAAFGLNYADVMARMGLYPEMPPMPCVLGYDVCGEIVEVGSQVTRVKLGDHVVALTRFGGYAEYSATDERVCMVVDKAIPAYQQLSMATQLSTSYCATVESINLREGDTILVHAAAGGVGLGIVQIAIQKKCNIIAIAGSDEKLSFLKSIGAHHTINYKTEDIYQKLKKLGLHKNIDFIFDSVAGGKNISKGYKALNSGGKYVIFGVSKLSAHKNIFGLIPELISFATTLFSPAKFLMPSKSMIGINMLAIADRKPEVVERCMLGVYDMFKQGVFSHIQGKDYTKSQLVEAHQLLEDGKTMGKLAVII